jgi:predicted kinase
MLYIFSGLPGSGKTTLAERLAERLQATYLRVDTVEQGLRDLCAIEVQGEGYGLAYRVAADNLRLGVSVVADSCNPIELTRREWQEVALGAQAGYVNIEVVCSDPVEHHRRVETREASIEGLRLPTWDEVERREYSEWRTERLVIDTAGRTEETSFDELIARLGLRDGGRGRRMELAANVFDVWAFQRTGQEIRFLLLYTSEEKASRYFNGGRFWQIPSGVVESGEGVTEAIHRVLASYGLRPDAIWAAEHSYLIYNRRFCQMQAIGVYAAEVADAAILLDPTEHSTYEWFSLEEAHDRVHYRGLKDGLRSVDDYITGVPEPARELCLHEREDS